MVKYRNVATGREYTFPAKDAWLEASSGWTRVEEPEGETPADDKDEKE